MKRLSNLINETNITVEFCKAAILEAAKGKRKRYAVRKTLAKIDKRAVEIRDIVLSETFLPSPCLYETRLEKGKLRKLRKPKFYPDQIIHHILIMLIRDKLMKYIDPYAVAGLVGRGCHKGVRNLRYWIQRKQNCEVNNKYCLKADIRKCFENIKPIVVLNKYAEYIKDKKYLRLMFKVLFQFDELPLGSYISAYTLNFLLKELDVAIREQKCVKHYIRYMDDLVILGRSKEELKVLKPIIKKKLAELGLTLKYNYQIFSVDKRGLDVMGFRIFRNNIIVRKSTQYGIYKCLRSGLNKSKKKQSMASRWGQIKHCDSKYLYKIIGKNWGSIS